jgi:pimeloyl-ACP methyl ester carboxylesterase
MKLTNVVFVHGAWVTPLCWEKFVGFYEARGVTCLAPAWPYKDRPIEQLRHSPDPELGRLSIGQIVDHYADIIRRMGVPPVLIGHSFGGLFVQMLLDRGLGAAGVAIDSAPPKGVLPFLHPSAVRANFRILVTPGLWNRVIQLSLAGFQYAFVNNMSESEQRTAYDRYVVPESGRIFFQTAFALFNNATRIIFRNSTRPPLLMIAGSADHVCPAAQNRVNYDRYKSSTARTDFKEFPNRAHWIIGQTGWEEVATFIADWTSSL